MCLISWLLVPARLAYWLSVSAALSIIAQSVLVPCAAELVAQLCIALLNSVHPLVCCTAVALTSG